MTRTSTACFALALLVLAVLFRTFISGWGPPAEPVASSVTLFGLAAYPADNLSYVSWAQQAKDGRWLFDILYTTTDHQRLFFNPLFLLVGQVAALLAVSPLLVLNVLAVFSLPLVVFSVSSMCRALGLGGGATFAATCLAIGGGGISWARRAVEWSGVGQILPVGPTGPDLYFYDVYPVVAYFIAPYHVVSLAFLAVLSAVIVRFDDHNRRLSTTGLITLVSLGFLVAGIRPHTAIMVLAAYGVATGVSLLLERSAPLSIRRVIVCACLAGSMLPPVLYSVWVAGQPVWRAYALTHRPETNDWLIGFFLLWALGGLGAGLLGVQRLVRSPFAFLSAWALGAGVLLLMLNGFIYPKLTYGFTMALAILAGVGIERGKKHLRGPVLVAATVAIAFLALASPLVMINQVVLARGTTASWA